MDLKQRAKVLRGRRGQCIERHTFKVGEIFGHMTHKAGLIRLAAHRHGCQLGRIGFYQHTLEWHRARNLLQCLSVFEGHNSGEGDIKTHGNRRLGYLQ